MFCFAGRGQGSVPAATQSPTDATLRLMNKSWRLTGPVHAFSSTHFPCIFHRAFFCTHQVRASPPKCVLNMNPQQTLLHVKERLLRVAMKVIVTSHLRLRETHRIAKTKTTSFGRTSNAPRTSNFIVANFNLGISDLSIKPLAGRNIMLELAAFLINSFLAQTLKGSENVRLQVCARFNRK